MSKVSHDKGEARSTDSYSKSNYLISAKYKSSIYENKILAIALAHFKQATQESENAPYILSMSAKQIHDIIGGSSSNVYHQLKSVAEEMTGRVIGVTDDENKRFEYISIITKSTYENGVFTIYFNSDFEKYYKRLEQRGKFTILNLPTMMAFKSGYSFRLYELLKSIAYNGRKSIQQNLDNSWEITFNLSELKFELGVVNASSDRVARMLKNKEYPDFEKAEEIAPEKSFASWREFRRCVLIPSTEEISEKIDMIVEFTPERKGLGGKTTNVTFKVSYKTALSEEPEVINQDGSAAEEVDIYNLIDEVNGIIKEKLPTKDIVSILEASDYNLKMIREKYQIAQSAGNISNLSGWLISAIKNNYTKPVAKNNSNFAGRDNGETLADLEKKLLQ